MYKSITAWIALLLVVFLAACSETPAPKTAFAISGQIVDDSGNGVGAVTVALSGNQSKSAATDANGNYTFSDLEDGEYVLKPNQSGASFSPARKSVTIKGANAGPVNFKALFGSVTPSATYSIAGTIVDDTQAPVAGVMVSLSGDSSATTTTDANGDYLFEGLPAGSYAVSASLAGYSFTTVSQAIAISSASITQINFSCIRIPAPTPATFSISGQVTDGSGAGVGRVTLMLQGTNTTTTSAADGAFSFTNLSSGSYTVVPQQTGTTFSPVSAVATINAASVSGVNFIASTPTTPTFSVSGHVSTTSGANIPGVRISLNGPTPGSMTTDAVGNYTLTGIANGDYTATASLAGYTFAPTVLAITVSNANVTGADFTGTPPPPATFNVSGRIVDGNGAALPGVSVASSGDSAATVQTDATGNYSFTSLVAGTYTVTPTAATFSFTPRNQTVQVTNANIAAINFVGNALTYSLTGRVALNTGGGLSGVTIALGGAATRSTLTDANGDYRFDNLVNGTYTIGATLADYTFSPASQNVSINNADTSAVLITATRVQTYSISGRVTDGSNNALSGASLLITAGNTLGEPTTATDAQGNYSFSGLSSGTTYHLTVGLSGYTFAQATATVTISGSDVSSVNFIGTAVATTFSVSGRLVTSNTAAAIAGVTLTLDSMTTTTDANGDYLFSGIANGTYTLTPSLTGYTFTPPTTSVTVNNANVANINFAGTPPAATTYTISGRVVDKSSAAVSNVSIALSGATTAATTTDASGNFTFGGLANGAYTLTPSLSGYMFAPPSADVTIASANRTVADFVATPPAPGVRNYTLFINAGTLTVHGAGGASMPAWSFTDVSGTPKFPGPVLTANEGDTVNITVMNDHTLSHNFVLKGIATDTAAIAPGTSKVYTFNATNAGTYLYYDSLDNNINREMGMYGALIVGPASGGNNAWTNGPAYTFQRLWVASDLDKPFWNDVAGAGGAVDTANYKPNYFLINGMGGFDGMDDMVNTAIVGKVGDTALVRILNAGQYMQTFHFHANHIQVLSVNGVRRAAPYKLLDVIQVPPLGGADVLFVLNQPGNYPMHNHTAQMETANGVYLNGVATMIYISP